MRLQHMPDSEHVLCECLLSRSSSPSFRIKSPDSPPLITSSSGAVPELPHAITQHGLAWAGPPTRTFFQCIQSALCVSGSCRVFDLWLGICGCKGPTPSAALVLELHSFQKAL